MSQEQTRAQLQSRPTSSVAEVLLLQTTGAQEAGSKMEHSVPEPNQRLQNITATQYVLFYNELNPNYFPTLSNPSCACTSIGKAVLQTCKSTPAPQHIA